MGTSLVRPSTRSVEGPAGSIACEPRVMQVLLAFVDAGGAVLSREDLMRICWGGAVVGDDAINRTIAEIRRVARSAGAGFGVETIPRVGYRLTGYEAPVQLDSVPDSLPEPPAHPVGDAQSASPSRRWIMGAAIATAVAGSVGLWWLRGQNKDPRFEELMETGRQALRMGLPGSDRQAADAFGAAVKIHQDDALAWGLLSLALWNVSNLSPTREAGEAIVACEQAARRALQLKPGEPNARFTLMMMQRRQADWFSMESGLHDILATDPENNPALDQLVGMLQAAGYVRESWDLNEKAIAYDPLRPNPQYRKALKLWILGREDEADQHAAQIMENWPLNPLVRNARLLVSAFTGRYRAARLLVDDPATRTEMLSPEGIRMWQRGLTALETRARADIDAAREASLAAAPLNPGLSVHAALLMSGLNEVDAAYQVVEGFMLRRGLLVTRERSGSGTEYETDLTWRNTQWLFTPASKAVRFDPRFPLLCDAIGLTEYWKRRGILPDERRTGA